MPAFDPLRRFANPDYRIAKRIGNAGHCIGRPRTGGNNRAAQIPGHARVAIGGVCGNLLVAHVDDLDTFIDAAVVDVDDMTATQREDRIDALGLQCFCNEMAAGNHARIAALALQSIFGCRRLRGNRNGVWTCHRASNSKSDRRARAAAETKRIVKQCRSVPVGGSSPGGGGDRCCSRRDT